MSFKFGTSSAPSTGGFGVTQSPATGLFGSSTQPATTQFGSTAFGNQQQSNTGFGATQPISTAGFGSQPAGTNTATVATPAFGSSSFGNAAKPTFGFSTNTTQQSTGFQSQPSQTANIFGPSTVQPTMGQSQFPQAQNQLPIEPHLAEYIQHLEGCWNPNSPSCQFKHYFYNMVHPSEVSLYGPQPGEDPVLYEQACQDNPDPTWFNFLI